VAATQLSESFDVVFIVRIALDLSKYQVHQRTYGGFIDFNFLEFDDGKATVTD